MAPWILPLATAVVSAAKERQQKGEAQDKAREDALYNMHIGRAASLGYPAEGIQAQRQAQTLEDTYRRRLADGDELNLDDRKNFIGALIPILMNKGA